jgi:hypothetical protein
MARHSVSIHDIIVYGWGALGALCELTRSLPLFAWVLYI